jgi:hypothetical protein
MTTTSIMPTPRQRYFNNDGTPAAGCYLYTYAAGSSTPKAVYTDFAGTIPHANPIVLDSKGETLAYFSGNYKLDLKTAAGVQVTGYPVDNFQSFDAQIAASDAALRAELAATNGGTLSGFIHTAAGSVARTLHDNELDTYSALQPMTTAQRADVRTNAGTLDVKAPLQLAANYGDMPLPDGTMLVKSGITFAEPVSMIGRGPKSIVKIAADFANATDVFIVSPTATEKRNWEFKDFQVTNAGTAARNVFRLDIATAGKFLNKLKIKGVIADEVTGYFVELLNTIPNVDGLFTSVFEDNWSMNGYYLDNVGDSVILQRNTTTQTGRGYYVNQLPGASHIIIRDGNCTSPGGVLIANSWNLLYDNMQTEVGTYNGTGTGLVTVQNGGAAENVNLRITNSNINTNGATNTTLACVYLANSENAQVEGCTLITNGSTGAHIVIASTARNTYVGPNSYFSSAGAEIAAIISDSGVGTAGIWKIASETTWTTGELDFFKDKDGFVHLRGNLSGGASTAGQVITTLPVGFRPTTAQTLVANYGSAVAAVQISTAGAVTLTVNGQTLCYFDGLTFSTRA